MTIIYNLSCRKFKASKLPTRVTGVSWDVIQNTCYITESITTTLSFAGTQQYLQRSVVPSDRIRDNGHKLKHEIQP